jgi:hypothetical protein
VQSNRRYLTILAKQEFSILSFGEKLSVPVFYKTKQCSKISQFLRGLECKDHAKEIA